MKKNALLILSVLIPTLSFANLKDSSGTTEKNSKAPSKKITLFEELSLRGIGETVDGSGGTPGRTGSNGGGSKTTTIGQ